jgi:hypothetical protein
VDHVRSQLTVSERRACAVVGQPRSTQRRQPKVRPDEAALTEAIVRLATRYGRYGYRRIRRLLLDEGWDVSVKRVYRIWLREGLKVPKKQPKRGRLWLNDGSCIRLRPNGPITSGPTTSCRIALRTGGAFACPSSSPATCASGSAGSA